MRFKRFGIYFILLGEWGKSSSSISSYPIEFVKFQGKVE